MGPTTGRSGQAPARRQRRHAAGRRPASAPLDVPAQPGPTEAEHSPEIGYRPGLPPGAIFPARTALPAGAADTARAALPAGTARSRGASVPARIAAVSGYLLSVPASFIPPALICLLSRRDAVFLRAHAFQAMNAAFTTLLYAVSSAILAAVLALDSLRLGLQVGATTLMFCWLITAGYLIAAAASAARGRFYQIPRCLCADLLRP